MSYLVFGRAELKERQLPSRSRFGPRSTARCAARLCAPSQQAANACGPNSLGEIRKAQLTVPISRALVFRFGHTTTSPSCISCTNRYSVPAFDGIFRLVEIRHMLADCGLERFPSCLDLRQITELVPTDPHGFVSDRVDDD